MQPRKAATSHLGKSQHCSRQKSAQPSARCAVKPEKPAALMHPARMRAARSGKIDAMTIKMQLLAVLAALATLGVSASAQTTSQDELSARLMRRELQRAPLSIPGREVVQVLTEIPPGVSSGWHVHPGEEVGYIAAGEVEMMVAGRPTIILRSGDAFLIPLRTPHNARDLGPATGEMISTYIVESGQPLSTIVAAPDTAQ
jgi:quercetin dioxygenase-like cupin family protein